MLAGYDHLLRAAERLRWDEADIGLTADARAWPAVRPPQKAALRRLIAGFCVAETAVAEHLAPFESAATHDPVLRACFAAQADDERRHARFFRRVAREVVRMDADTEARGAAGPALVALFEEDLPHTAGALARGDCALADAVGLYHLVLEGVVFAAAQTAALDLLDGLGTLPGVRDGVARVQGDERWHVGLGVRCLQDAGVEAPAVAALLGRAGQAAEVWGPGVLDDERIRDALGLARRRLAIAAAGARSATRRAGGSARRPAPPGRPPAHPRRR